MGRCPTTLSPPMMEDTMRMYVSPEFVKEYSVVSREIYERSGIRLDEAAGTLLAGIRRDIARFADPVEAYQLKMEAANGDEEISLFTFVPMDNPKRAVMNKLKARSFLRGKQKQQAYGDSVVFAAAVMNCTPEEALMAAMKALMQAYKTANLAAD